MLNSATVDVAKSQIHSNAGGHDDLTLMLPQCGQLRTFDARDARRVDTR